MNISQRKAVKCVYMSSIMNKRIIIIGASSGVGRRLACDFARMGYKVGISARREEKLKEIAREYPDNIVYRAFDVAAADALSEFNNLIEDNNGMDILLYAAGAGFVNPTLDPALDRTMVEVNVKGFTTIVSAAYRYFRDTANERPGHIAAITSVAGTKGIGIAAAYSASKRYQQNYLQALSQLSRSQGVELKITDIRPGFIRTAFLDPDRNYPMLMAVSYVAPLIEKAILKGKRVATIDWRWNVVEGLWKLLPSWIWERMRINF